SYTARTAIVEFGDSCVAVGQPMITLSTNLRIGARLLRQGERDVRARQRRPAATPALAAAAPSGTSGFAALRGGRFWGSSGRRPCGAATDGIVERGGERGVRLGHRQHDELPPVHLIGGRHPLGPVWQTVHPELLARVTVVGTHLSLGTGCEED